MLCALIYWNGRSYWIKRNFGAWLALIQWSVSGMLCLLQRCVSHNCGLKKNGLKQKQKKQREEFGYLRASHMVKWTDKIFTAIILMRIHLIFYSEKNIVLLTPPFTRLIWLKRCLCHLSIVAIHRNCEHNRSCDEWKRVFFRECCELATKCVKILINKWNVKSNQQSRMQWHDYYYRNIWIRMGRAFFLHWKRKHACVEW